MRTSDVVIWLAGVIATGGLLPVAYVAVREVRRRRATALALNKVQQAQALLQTVDATGIESAAAALRKFDVTTLERTIEGLLQDGDATRHGIATQLAVALRIVERYVDRARTAAAWAERAHAVQMLGNLALSSCVPALSAVLRDKYEDASIRAAAGEALAKIKDPDAVPALVKEMLEVDEHATPLLAEAVVHFGPLATREVLGLLADQDHPQVRIWAARILGSIGDLSAIEPLISRLRDRQELLRVAVADALGGFKDRRALQPLTQVMLRDPAPQVRAHAAAAVGQIAGEEAAGVLIAAFSDPDFATRLRAIEAFESMQLADTSALQSALNDSNAEVRKRAAVALDRTGHLEQIVGQLASDDREVARTAYASIMQLGAAGLVEGIAVWLRHDSMQVRSLVAKACGELGILRLGPLVMACLDDPVWPVRASVCEALGRLRPAGSVPELIRMLSDIEEPVREAAAAAISLHTDSDLQPYELEVLAAYQNGSIPLRLAMVDAAARMTGPTMTQLVVDATRDPSEAVRLRAVRALSGKPTEIAVPALIAALSDPTIAVRLAAVPALGNAGTPRAFNVLLRALAGAEVDFREQVTQALSRMDRQQLLENAERLADSEALDVRLGIAWTLGKISDPVGLPILARYLRDKDARLRASAAGALGKLPGAETVALLLQAVDDRDPKTRAAIVNAIAKTASNEPPVIAALERRLLDPDAFVRNRAGIAVARIARQCALEICLNPQRRRLFDDAVWVVMLALSGAEQAVTLALSALVDPERRKHVHALLDREDPALRTAFFTGLRLPDPAGQDQGALLDPVALAQQYEQLLRASQDVGERRAAVEALARLPVEFASHVFADALAADPSEDVRLRSAQVLSEHVKDNPIARTALARALSDPNDAVALAAVQALRTRREPEISAALLRRLGAGSPAINAAIEEVLAEFHAADPLSFIDRSMGSDQPQDIVSAIRVLTRMANPQTLPFIAELTKSRETAIRSEAVQALGQLASPEAWAIVGRMLDDPNETVRVAVLEAMSTSGPDALIRLAAARGDPSVKVRCRLAELLDQHAGPAVTKLLENLLQDASRAVRATALATMLTIADSENLRRFSAAWPTAGVEVRLALRADQRAASTTKKLANMLLVVTDGNVREAAVNGIAALAAPGYERHLLPVIGDPRPGMRVAAARALASSGDPEIRQRISHLLEDPEVTVREAVREALLASVR